MYKTKHRQKPVGSGGDGRLVSFGIFMNIQIFEGVCPDLSWNLPGNVIQLGYPPNRIDLLTEVSGFVFDECYPDKVKVVIDDLTLDFIDIINLRVNKKASGRH